MTFSRREFLLGSVPAVVLAACGGTGDSTGATAPASTTAPTTAPQSLAVAQLFSPGPFVPARSNQRLPFALVGSNGPLRGDGEPASVQIAGPSGVVDEEVASARFVPHPHEDDAHDHAHVDELRYYAPRVDLTETGKHRMSIEVPEGSASIEFDVVEPADVPIVGIGDRFPSFVSPSVANLAGVDTLCTRKPQCGLHTDSVDGLLGEGKPFVMLVSTPAYCQTQFCGPVLEVLLDAVRDSSDPALGAVHLEVWANPAEVGGDIGDPAIRPAPGVEVLALPFEPALYVVGGDGVIRERLDNLFDADELAGALALAQS